MRALFLTTPHMHGEDVRRLQRALNESRYGDFLRGTGVDGDFGVYTAQAVYRAKYWLGYAKPSKRAGRTLCEYLEGNRQLTTKMHDRRERRKTRRVTRPVRLWALAKMAEFIGETEHPPGSNRCPASQWWGWPGPWCAMEVSRAYALVGSKAFARGSRFASVSALYQAAHAGQYGLSLTRAPQPGDLALFRFAGATTAFSHVGMVVMPKPLATIEGNTSPDNGGSQDNGGMCCRKDREDERRAGMVRAYVHVSR